jgi:hypothetical protein
MRNQLLVALALVTVLPVSTAASTPRVATADAVSADPAVAAPAIAALRAEGSAGLARLLEAFRDEVSLAREGRDAGPQWERIRAALDGVGAQRDCYTSGLYWFTDLDVARAAAARTGRPILSLRLLGRLDEELSCANSRYFRAALYANERVAALLADRFVLHWSSERPAPRITIDYGDGRTLVRTVTGNSIHYVLDAEGRVVDALPGLYGPGAFHGELAAIADEYRDLAPLAPAARAERVRSSSRAKHAAAAREWAKLMRGLRGVRVPAVRPKAPTDRLPEPRADAASVVAVTKSIAELPLLEALDLATAPERRPFDDAVWPAVAPARGSAALDDRSRALMRRHLYGGEDEALVFERFESSMTIDTVRNEFAIRPQIHRRLAESDAFHDVEALNRYVYERLFLTPAADPWLGLAPRAAYTAIEGGGLVHATPVRHPER